MSAPSAGLRNSKQDNMYRRLQLQDAGEYIAQETLYVYFIKISMPMTTKDMSGTFVPVTYVRMPHHVEKAQTNSPEVPVPCLNSLRDSVGQGQLRFLIHIQSNKVSNSYRIQKKDRSTLISPAKRPHFIPNAVLCNAHIHTLNH